MFGFDKFVILKVAQRLWTLHVELTRTVILGIANDSPTLMNDIKELLKNQEDIGNTLRSKYGDEIADQFTILLKEHITIAGDLLQAAKANSNTVEYLKVKWYQNADDIAMFLCRLSKKLQYEKVRALLHKHLELTLNEGVAQLQRKADESLHWYGQALHQVLQIADVLSMGLLNQVMLHGTHLMGLFI